MIRVLTVILALASLVLSADDKVLIWEAKSPELPGKAYVAGSIHIGKSQWYPLDRTYDRVFDEAGAVYFEIYRPDHQAVAQKTLLYGIFRDGKTLSQILGYADFQTVCNFYAQRSPGMNSALLERFRPWVLSVQISQFYLQQHPEISRSFGLENVFTRHMGDKTAGSLESIDDQLRGMSEVSDAAAGRLLMDGIRNFVHAGRDLNRIFRALETGEPDDLSLIANEMALKHPEVHRCLFLKRNQAIAEKIYEMLKSRQTVFILVGAGHLAGKGNILEMLRNRGCSTVQLKRSGKPGRIQP